jgi:hypothetical protein
VTGRTTLESGSAEALPSARQVGHEIDFFLFNGKFYEQTESTAMGNALSPFLVNLYSANFEMVLKRSNLLPKVLVRYVDDIFCVINRRKVNTLLSLLNSQNPSIKFTCEEEVDGSLPFLDVRVTRRDSTLEFDVYRKPTLSVVFLSHGTQHGYLRLHVAPGL